MFLKSRLKILKAFLLSLTMAILLPMGAHAQTDFPIVPISDVQVEKESDRDKEYDIYIDMDELVGHPGTDAEAPAVRAESGARAVIHEGLRQHAERIDIRGYNLTFNEASKLLMDVIYWDGSLFYAEGVSMTMGSPEYAHYIYPRYIENEKEVEKALKKVLKETITPDMSDFQKILALYNWLVTHCTYDYTYSKYTAYDALVTGSSVCQGYMEAYRMLLRYAGVLEVGSARGDNHTWNQVKVDGQWYNVDATWDSGMIVAAPFGQMSYRFFLSSDSKFQEGDHTFESQAHECTSTLYDDGGGWWEEKNVFSPAVPIDGEGSYRIGYDDDDSRMSLIFRKEATGAERVVYTFDNSSWKGIAGVFYGNLGCYGVIVRTGNATYVNDAKSIYRFTDDGKVSSIYTYTGTDGRKIFGMRERHGKLEIQIGYNAYQINEAEIITIPLESYIVPVDDVESFVKRLYTVCLGRKYDEEGLNNWVEQLDSQTKSAAEVAQGFFFSDEFKEKKYSDQEYLNILYRTMFDRDGDEGGMESWLSKLENGVSRLYVFRGFAESDEFTQLCDRYEVIRGSVDAMAWRDRNPGATGFIARLYTKMLGRRFDEDGLEDWCRVYLTGERTIEEIASDGFLHSNELLGQNLSDEEFVLRMYQTFLNRQPDSKGFSDWVSRLKSGEENRDTLVYGFTRSKEFGELKASYGL